MTDNLLDNEMPTVDMPQAVEMAGKPMNLPEKFWDMEKKEIRMDALINSYAALEQRLSKSVDLPETDEDKFNLLRKMGVPETSDQYDVDVSHGMFDIDGDVNERLHKCGCTPEQVQEVYNLAAEKIVPMVMELAAEFEAEREVEKLVEHFGGAEKWREVSRQLLAFGQKHMPDNVLDNMASSYEGVLALYKMMQGEEPVIKADPATRTTPAGEQDLQQMMRDPKYWRDKDPAFISKVTDGFKKIYTE